MPTFLQRIHQVGSTRSVRSRNNNSNDASSAATFEFENMDAVRGDEESNRRKMRGRRRTNPPVEVLSVPEAGIPVEAPIEVRDDSAIFNKGPTLDLRVIEGSERSYQMLGSERSSFMSLSSGVSSLLPSKPMARSLLVGFVGIMTSTFFLGFGISRAVDEQADLFSLMSEEFSREFIRSWNEYIVASLWLYEIVISHSLTRDDFQHYYNVVSSQVDVVSVEWVPRIYDENRSSLEQEALQYYELSYPEIVDYRGIMAVVFEDPEDQNSVTNLKYQSQFEYYHPYHLVEPINEMTASLIEVDVLSSPLKLEALEYALQNQQPAITYPYYRLTPQSELSEEKFIQLFHPGLEIEDKMSEFARDAVGITIRLRSIIESVQKYLPNDMSVYIYDTTTEYDEPTFLVAAELYQDPLEDTGATIVYVEETSFSDLIEDTVKFLHVEEIDAASHKWTIVTVAVEDTFVADLQLIVVTGQFILLASLCIAMWMITSYRRIRSMLEMRRKSDNERTTLIVRNIREKAKAEQELNDYIAHEVRNPLTAAMSACTFVKTALNTKQPIDKEATVESLREDVEIIDSSLTFTHDLLRSMLDMHRAAGKKLAVDNMPVDVLRDVLEPVTAMLYTRHSNFEVRTSCPDGLYIKSDRLRLKQILLNLARNSVRYVQRGFVNVFAEVVDGQVRLCVEDSGPGIAFERRKYLFSKFQESLEIMDQGSGVGLCLCQAMAGLLGGEILLDEDFDSGIAGSPGSRFIVEMKQSPMPREDLKLFIDSSERATDTTQEECDSNDEVGMGSCQSARSRPASPQGEKEPLLADVPASPVIEDAAPETIELPPNLSVLFVDDDTILRKLFMRSLRKVMPNWNVEEAASGEAALKLIESKTFDLIFMDQYMASVEKKLLGTETVLALRSRGVNSRICGLSANDVEEAFLNNGADCFMFKPFPCKKDQLEKELHRILSLEREYDPDCHDLSSFRPGNENETTDVKPF